MGGWRARSSTAYAKDISAYSWQWMALVIGLPPETQSLVIMNALCSLADVPLGVHKRLKGPIILRDANRPARSSMLCNELYDNYHSIGYPIF